MRRWWSAGALWAMVAGVFAGGALAPVPAYATPASAPSAYGSSASSVPAPLVRTTPTLPARTASPMHSAIVTLTHPGVVLGNGPSPVARPVLSALADVPGVASVTWLPTGQVMVAGALLDSSAVRALPGVSAVSTAPSAAVSGAVAVPNDPYFSYEWDLRNTGTAWGQSSATPGMDIHALSAWSVADGTGQVIADLDTGMALANPDLAGAVWTNPDVACGSSTIDPVGNPSGTYVGDCHGWNWVTGTADVTNPGENFHGTAVAGVIAATAGNGTGMAGAAPGARVMPLVVGSGTTVQLGYATAAVYYAVSHGATVINMSFGGSSDYTPLDAAISYATSHGVPVVIAAANNSSNNDTSPVWPANDSLTNPGVITVGAVDATGALASFSNFGAASVDVFAPGVIVPVSLDPAASSSGGALVGPASGTSFAAPLVAASVAVYRQLNPAATPAQIRTAVETTAVPVAALDGMGVSPGVVNMAALAGVAASEPAVPPSTSPPPSSSQPPSSSLTPSPQAPSPGGSSGGGASPGGSSVVASRIGGATRDATAAALATSDYPTVGSAAVVVLARNDVYADALTGSPLAAALGGPLLLTAPSALSDSARQAIASVLAPGGTVVVLGGTGAISPAVTAQLTRLGYVVQRIGGATRYQTATLIASAILAADPVSHVYLATGENFPDAESAAAAAGVTHGVVLLTEGPVLAASTNAWLAAHPQAAASTVAVGAPAAAAAPAAASYVGASRYSTSALVAAAVAPGTSGLVLATGAVFPDGLAGAAYAAHHGWFLLLVDPSAATLDPSQAAYLARVGSSVSSMVVVGGLGAVPSAAVSLLTQAMA